MEIKRWQVESTKNALKHRRAVSISGARQTGKTTLARQTMDAKCVYRSLDENELLQAAQYDPHEFVKNSAGTMIIDEIQKAPALMSEIKLAVDMDNRPGQYLITGSANIQAIASINDSLAGRIRHIRLRPFTVGEILGNKPVFLKKAFSGKFPVQIKNYDKDAIFDLAFRGGYPEAVRLKKLNERRKWHMDYINSIISKDLHEVESIRRLDTVMDLVKILAGWSSKYLDKAQIGASLEVSKPTLNIYLNALIVLYIFERVAPWTKTDYELVGKKSKIYATDSGLMASLLNWKRENLFLDADRSGKLMETFVFQELAAQVDLDSDYSLYQYRDAKKREIDFLVEKEGEGLIGIEVKSSRSVSKDDFASQIWFKENLVKNRMPYRGYVLYSGENTLSFGDGMKAVPIAALWANQ